MVDDWHFLHTPAYSCQSYHDIFRTTSLLTKAFKHPFYDISFWFIDVDINQCKDGLHNCGDVSIAFAKLVQNTVVSDTAMNHSET